MALGPVVPDSVMFDILSHDTSISPATSSCSTTHPRFSVHTGWSPVPITSAPSLVVNRNTSRTPRSHLATTSRYPARVSAMSPGDTSSIGTGPRSVWIREPSATQFVSARRRSTSFSVGVPTIHTRDPLGYRTHAPPGADGSHLACPLDRVSSPLGPSTAAAMPSPRVGAMTRARRFGVSIMAVWSSHIAAKDLPAPRPAIMANPSVFSSGSCLRHGGIWCSWSTTRPASRSRSPSASCVPVMVAMCEGYTRGIPCA